MYSAMLFLGWNLNTTSAKWSIDVGWASVWVKIVSEWLAFGLYREHPCLLFLTWFRNPDHHKLVGRLLGPIVLLAGNRVPCQWSIVATV